MYDDFLNIISKELKIEANTYEKIEAYMKYKKGNFKFSEKKYEDQFNDYRNEIIEEKEKCINEKLSDLPIHHLINQIKLIELLWDFDCVSLYPSAMWDENSIYAKIETGYVLKNI